MAYIFPAPASGGLSGLSEKTSENRKPSLSNVTFSPSLPNGPRPASPPESDVTGCVYFFAGCASVCGGCGVRNLNEGAAGVTVGDGMAKREGTWDIGGWGTGWAGEGPGHTLGVGASWGFGAATSSGLRGGTVLGGGREVRGRGGHWRTHVGLHAGGLGLIWVDVIRTLKIEVKVKTGVACDTLSPFGCRPERMAGGFSGQGRERKCRCCSRWWAEPTGRKDRGGAEKGAFGGVRCRGACLRCRVAAGMGAGLPCDIGGEGGAPEGPVGDEVLLVLLVEVDGLHHHEVVPIDQLERHCAVGEETEGGGARGGGWGIGGVRKAVLDTMENIRGKKT